MTHVKYATPNRAGAMHRGEVISLCNCAQLCFTWTQNNPKNFISTKNVSGLKRIRVLRKWNDMRLDVISVLKTLLGTFFDQLINAERILLISTHPFSLSKQFRECFLQRSTWFDKRLTIFQEIQTGFRWHFEVLDFSYFVDFMLCLYFT